MLINGLQKLTLLDYPGKVACTVFSGGCNFRCPFCHNASLVADVARVPVMSEDEVLGYLKKRQGIVEGVCFTGGEPTLQPDLGDFMARVKALGYAVKLDTNGSRPNILRSLIEKGLVDYVAMDIKSCPARYAAVTGIEGLDLAPITESKDLLIEGRVDYEFRTTAVRELHSLEDFAPLGEYIRGAKRWFLQSYKDSGDILGGSIYSAHDKNTLLKMLEAAAPYVVSAQLRGVD